MVAPNIRPDIRPTRFLANEVMGQTRVQYGNKCYFIYMNTVRYPAKPVSGATLLKCPKFGDTALSWDIFFVKSQFVARKR